MRDIAIQGRGATIAAWHFTPEQILDGERAPCVILAHGLCGVRSMSLDKFGARFAAQGYHALAFDYRFWGASGGEPRQIVSIRHQLRDWLDVIRFARTLDGVDPARIVLWGTSFSGGHVVVA